MGAENYKTTLFWYRRDLRLHDNRGLYYALKENNNILPVFIFDTLILSDFEDRWDKRISFIFQVLKKMKQELEKSGSTILVLTGEPRQVFQDLIKRYDIDGLYFNVDYEPNALERDKDVTHIFEKQGIPVKSFKDQVIFDTNNILKDNGTPYSVFTPYMRQWKKALRDEDLAEYPVEKYFDHFCCCEPCSMPGLDKIGFQPVQATFPSEKINTEVIKQYDAYRDYPAMDYTSRLGIHLRFGTVSIRKTVKKAEQLNEIWLNQLIWREFFMMILWHHPRIVDQSFKTKYDNIHWRNIEKEFEAWCEGRTGYPIVDAGMRQLNESGYMHNRVRMITASFLTKHLLIDWRWGEAYFAQKLLDYELASNNGGWQWASGSGCDAVPYFRIFNPARQLKRFDPEEKYIKRWVKEYGTDAYPKPIIDHKNARERALKEYKRALNE